MFSNVPSSSTAVSKSATPKQPQDAECLEFTYTLCNISIPYCPQPPYIPLVNSGRTKAYASVPILKLWELLDESNIN
jgi:hypothetical protein